MPKEKTMTVGAVLDGLHTLHSSCLEGHDGTWDCSTDEGRESFLAMADEIKRIIAQIRRWEGVIQGEKQAGYLVIGHYDDTGETFTSRVDVSTPEDALANIAKKMLRENLTLIGAVNLATGIFMPPCEDSGKSCMVVDYPVNGATEEDEGGMTP
jgi:hypothetical protein